VDIVIKNGIVIDGSGAPGQKADVLIEDGAIKDIGSFGHVEAETVIDAQGKAVTPGFIDMHSHSDHSLPFAPYAESMTYQGVTTMVTGQCGSSPAPLSDLSRQEFIDELGDRAKLVDFGKISSFGDYLDLLRTQGVSTNVAPLVGHGAIRAAVMAYSSARPTEEQMDAMVRYAEEAMDAGAVGISTGLIYPPGYYATTEELIEVTRPVAKRGGIYFSHVRDENGGLLTAIEEEHKIALATGVALQHSHYKASGQANWHLSAPGLEAIDKIRAEGIDMTVDMYPYTGSSNGLIDSLPDWTREGGNEKCMQRLTDPATRARIRKEFVMEHAWDKILVSSSPNPAHVGRYCSELIAESGKDPFDWMFDALLETRGAINRISFGMSEENKKAELQYPWMMIGSDGYGLPATGPLAEGAPHPRSFGTFVRVLGHYVRDEKLFSLETGVHKMTGLTAAKLGLGDRGLLKPGYKADVVVFDPATVKDMATFTEPKQYARGVEQVITNGVFVIRDGKHTHALPGQIIGRK
jgi:N-acyl-D-amino-acid deacylase